MPLMQALALDLRTIADSILQVPLPLENGTSSCVTREWNQLTTTLASKVNVHHAINLRASCGEDFVTHPADVRGDETRVAHCAAMRPRSDMFLGLEEGFFQSLGFTVQVQNQCRVSYSRVCSRPRHDREKNLQVPRQVVWLGVQGQG